MIPREFWFSVDYVYIQRDPRTCDLILSDRPPQPDDSSKPDWKEISRKLDEAGAADF